MGQKGKHAAVAFCCGGSKSEKTQKTKAVQKERGGVNGGRLNRQLGFQGAEERGLLVSDYIKNSGSETRRGREEGGREGGTSVHLHVWEDAVMRSGAHIILAFSSSPSSPTSSPLSFQSFK